MKYLTLVLIALGISLALTSCNKEEILPNNTQTEQETQGAELVNIDLTSFVQQEEEDEMRFSYRDRDFYAKDDEGNNNSVVYPIMEEKPLNILVVARQNGGTTIYNKLQFNKVTGERKVNYKGKIKVPNTGTGTIELAAIILSEVGGREFVRYDEATKKVSVIPTTNLLRADDSGLISASVPYIARWTPITIVADPTVQDGVKLAKPAALSFKPSGTLVRVEFVNITDKNESILSFKVRSNSLFLNWHYDFEQLGSQENNTPNTLADGLLTGGITTQEHSFTLPEVIFLDKGTASPSYYFWAMPRSQADQGASDLRTDFIVTLQEGDGGLHEYKRISGNFLLRTGSAHLVKLYPSYGKSVAAP